MALKHSLNMTYLILLEGGLRLSIRSLALAVIPSYWRATSRGCHTRHRADLCNFVCLCSCLEKRNYSPLIEDEVPAFVSLKKLQFKNKPSCRDHCITYKEKKYICFRFKNHELRNCSILVLPVNLVKRRWLYNERGKVKS